MYQFPLSALPSFRIRHWMVLFLLILILILMMLLNLQATQAGSFLHGTRFIIAIEGVAVSPEEPVTVLFESFSVIQLCHVVNY